MKNASQPDGNRLGRDAIVMSGWNWETFNVPERLSLAFAHLGARVLYCENPVSFFRNSSRPQQQVEAGIYRATPKFLGHRLNRIPLLVPHLQSELLVAQILRRVEDLQLHNPLFVYPHGKFGFMCSAFKRRGYFLVHICMDYPEPSQRELIELSDLTLVIPKSLYAGLKAAHGDKVRLIPQVGRLPESGEMPASEQPNDLLAIPRPRLGYIGPVDGRLDLRVLAGVFAAQPTWHFVHFGKSKCLSFQNVHVLPWRSPEKLREVIAGLEIGFMPYARSDNKNLHCMPLKLFDYFAFGKPVVSTKILNLLEFTDTIYFGDDADELGRAIQMALGEPHESPRRAKRMAIARENSIETLANALSEVLAPSRKTADAVSI